MSASVLKILCFTTLARNTTQSLKKFQELATELFATLIGMERLDRRELLKIKTCNLA